MGTATVWEGTGPRLCRRAAGLTDGNTTRNIAVELRIVIERPRTDLGDQRAVIRWPTDKLVRGNSSAGRAAIYRVPAAREAG
jgi:hypothetical protein